MPRSCRLLPALSGLLFVLAAPPAQAGTPDWSEILLVQDGRYNNAARVAVDPWSAGIRLAWKAQLDTDSSTRQIAVGAQPWESPPAWHLQDITANASSKEYPDLVVTPDSVTHVVWREAVGTGDWQVLYASDRGGAWSMPRQLTFDATVKGSPTIAAHDSSGIVHIAYSTLETGTANDEIWYLRYDTIADDTDFLQVTDDAVSDDDAQIAVSWDGTLVSIAWVAGGFSGAIRCVEGDLGGFTDLPTGVVANASQPDLDVEPDGRQHLVYRHSAGGSIRVIRYLERAGAGFAAPVDVSPADAFYTQPSLIVAFHQLVTVIWVSNTTGHEGLWIATPPPTQEPPFAIMSDPDVTYNETDLVFLPQTVGLPGEPRPVGPGAALARSGGAGIAVVSTGYFDAQADSVKADLHVFAGSVLSTDAPLPIPRAAGLSLAARPNPFLAATDVSFVLPAPAARVRVEVIDVSGRRVAVLSDGARAAGPHSVRWDPAGAPAGVYWLRVSSGGVSESVGVRRLR